MKKENIGVILIVVFALVAIFALLLQQPIAQDVGYHSFYDFRPLFNILNFWNVMSNIPFLIVGLLGLHQIIIVNNLNVINEIKVSYIFLFIGIILVAFGSGYYHLTPDNQTLLWDRLPMTVTFMALFSIIISEFISVSIGKVLLLPLILAGVLSVLYWHFSELQGVGDLRFYAFVQFFPMLVIPVILVFFKSRYNHASGYWLLLLAYMVAKLFEYFDGEIYNTLGFISGHSLKHIAAALGLYVLLTSYAKRYSL